MGLALQEIPFRFLIVIVNKQNNNKCEWKTKK